jgi:hypothetical protein
MNFKESRKLEIGVGTPPSLDSREAAAPETTVQSRYQPPFPFLRLPRELRDQIYHEYILDSPPFLRYMYCRNACSLCKSDAPGGVPDTACRRHGLLLVSRQVSLEFLDLVPKGPRKHVFHLDGLCRDSRQWDVRALDKWFHHSWKTKIQQMQLIFNWDDDFTVNRRSRYRTHQTCLDKRHDVIDFAYTFPRLVELEVEYRVQGNLGLDFICGRTYGRVMVDEFVSPLLQKMLSLESLRRIKIKWASATVGQYNYVRSDSGDWQVC